MQWKKKGEVSMSEQRTIRSFVLHHYGNLISAEAPQFDENSRRWITQIKSDYPVVLQDDRTPDRRIIRFLSIKQIGTVYFTENLSFLRKESTSRDKCIKTVQALLNMWNSRAEKIVVQASADCLVRIPEFRHFFTPMEEVVDSLLEHDIVYDDDIMKYRSKEKQKKSIRYLKLLEGLDFIRRVEGGYESGEIFLMVRRKCESEHGLEEDTFKQAILSEIIRERYSTLRDVFEISRLQPTVHVDSCIYRPSIEAECLIHLTTSSIATSYTDSYGGRLNPLTLTHILRRLRSVKAITRRENYWSGTDELLTNMLDIKNKMPELAPPIA